MPIIAQRKRETPIGVVSAIASTEALHDNDTPCDAEIAIKVDGDSYWSDLWTGDRAHMQRMFDKVLECISNGMDCYTLADHMCEYDHNGQQVRV